MCREVEFFMNNGRKHITLEAESPTCQPPKDKFRQGTKFSGFSSIFLKTRSGCLLH